MSVMTIQKPRRRLVQANVAPFVAVGMSLGWAA